MLTRFAHVLYGSRILHRVQLEKSVIKWQVIFDQIISLSESASCSSKWCDLTSWNGFIRVRATNLSQLSCSCTSTILIMITQVCVDASQSGETDKLPTQSNSLWIVRANERLISNTMFRHALISKIYLGSQIRKSRLSCQVRSSLSLPSRNQNSLQ